RTYCRFVARIRDHDWDGLLATLGLNPTLDDRRRLARIKFAGEEFFAHLRIFFVVAWTRWDCELVATRGERLALFRERFDGAAPGDVGFVSEQLALEEVDADGRLVEGVGFDLIDLDAAYAELDARYAAGEAAVHPRVAGTMRAFVRAFASRDWDALAALFASDVVVHDHRLL